MEAQAHVLTVAALDAANRRPVSVSPSTTVTAAVTLMMTHGYSQLPVMTSSRDVKGIVSWESVATGLLRGRTSASAQDLMQTAVVVDATTPIFDVVRMVVDHDYVLVRALDRTIVGIVTGSDLSVQFGVLTEPFLRLSQIERGIRRLLADGAPLERIREAAGLDDLTAISELGFGDYVCCLQTPGIWSLLRLSIDRVIFCQGLDRVRLIRNAVMHFDPQGITTSDVDFLRQFEKTVGKLTRWQTEAGIGGPSTDSELS